MVNGKTVKKWLVAVVFLCGILLLNGNVHAQTATPYTNLTDWLAAVIPGSDEELLTTADKVGLADEVSVALEKNDTLGPELTFQSANTGLTRGFKVSAPNFVDDVAVDPFKKSGFIFNDQEGGNDTSFNDALSIGDRNNYENDDWSLSLLDSATMGAFAVTFRDSASQTGESMQFFLNDVAILSTPFDMSSAGPNPGSNADFFFGVTTNFLFDRVDFDEFAGSDDIAIADFRFATVVPEPVSSTLFVIGGVAFGLRSWRKKRMNA